MGLFKLFAGKSPADYERKGDAFAQGENWGEAKLAFESALEKSASQLPADLEMRHRLQEKLRTSKEALARNHRREAEAMMEAGYMDDARELLVLAMDLTADAQLKAALARQIEQVAPQQMPEIHLRTCDTATCLNDLEVDPAEEDANSQFNILLGTLPEKIQQEYRSYGYHFKYGYLALNQGAFDQAVEHLTQAAEANPEPSSLIPLELATAHVNLGHTAEAQALLEKLVRHQPDLLPAIQLLCDVYWSQQAYDKAMDLLDDLAPDLAESMAAYLLKGETLLQASRYEEARSFFQQVMEIYGWHDSVALCLARAHESLNQIPEARDIYAQMISQCTGCGSRVDPAIKRKYADLSLAAGEHSTNVLEYYLDLCQEDPANAVQYYRNISRIYAAQGQEIEARRFQAIAEEMDRRIKTTD
ncbi:MAG: tetratricopeptide repeat protein [Desulfobacteraceae bacterium]|jgi:tetratricopeptide (TPR) repeat protein